MALIGSYKYQLLLLGSNDYIHAVKKVIEEALKEELGKMGIPAGSLSFLRWAHEIDSRSPALGIYLGNSSHPGCLVMGELEELHKKGVPVFPVVRDLSTFRAKIPRPLHAINGLQLDPDATNMKGQVYALVALVLSAFHLFRNQRKVFISYCRKDAEPVAIQLFEELSAYNFYVFLDSYRIKKGDEFQRELEHRLKDSDIMLVLHSENYIKSPWVRKELEEAHTLQIGLVEVRLPGGHMDRKYASKYGELSYPVVPKRLGRNRRLSAAVCKEIVVAVEQWRIRSMQARIANLMAPFLKCLQKEKLPYSIYPPHTLIVSVNGVYVAFVLAVGIPDAAMMDDERIWVETHLNPKIGSVAKVCIVYDILYLRNRWKEHLRWLDASLPVKSIHIRERNLCISNILDKWD